MENLLLSMNVVLPLFFCIALGYGLKCISMYDDKALSQMNKLCFKVFLPVLLFYNIYTTDLTAAFNGKLLLYAAAGVLIWFTVLMIWIPRIEKGNPKRGVLVQGMMRSNFVLFGLPVATSLCGEENIGVTSLLIAVVVPMFNILSIIALEAYRGGKPSIRKMLIGIAKNPLLISSLLGVLFYFLKIQLPYAIEKSVKDISRVATPLSLVVLGGSFTFSSIKGYIKPLLLGVTGKLIISPVIFVGLAIAAGFRNVELASLMIMFGSPTAVSSFTMAQQMDGDGDLAAQLVVFSSALSIVTIFFWIFILKQCGFM